MPGEEKFGFLTSRMYPLVNAVPTLRRFYRFVISDLRGFNFSTILDIGSGTGSLLIRIYLEKNNISATGIDPSPHMVEVASRKASRKKMDKSVHFYQGSNRHIPGDEKYDIITSSLSFHHWHDRSESVGQIMQRLNPGGKFLIYEVYDDGSFNRKIVKNHLMEKEDFEKIASEWNLSLKILQSGGFIRAQYEPFRK